MTDAQIKEHCAEAGLVLDSVSRRRGVLLLTPTTFDALPTAPTLAELARELQQAAGVRFVALDLEGLP